MNSIFQPLRLSFLLSSIFVAAFLCFSQGCSAIENYSPVSRAINPQNTSLIIEVASDEGEILNRQGFLHGDIASMPDIKSLQELKIQSWRLNDFKLNGWVKTNFLAKTTFNIIDAYSRDKEVNYDKFDWQNWDWKEYENFVEGLARQSLKSGRVDYWDIWPEPDWSFKGSQEDLKQVYVRTFSKIRSVIPEAKIIAPDLSKFDLQALNNFVQFCIDNHIQLDGISWHEYDVPQNVADHVKQVRVMLSQKSGICSPHCPQIHINEFQRPESHLVPAWNLAYFEQFENAKVDVVSRACWDSVENGKRYSDCYASVNGLFTKNRGLKRPLYWLHRAYAELENAKRLNVISPQYLDNTRLTALAAKNSKGDIQVLVGRYSCGRTNTWCSNQGYAANVDERNFPANLPVTVSGLTNKVQYLVNVEKIPNKNVTKVMSGYEFVSSQNLIAENGQLNIGLQNFEDGDVFRVKISEQKGF